MKRVSEAMSVFMLLAALAPNAMAATSSYPTKTFDAKYTITTPQGGSALRMVSDGKGHLRTESAASGFTSVTIIDYVTKKQTTLIPQGKMAVQSTIPAGGGYVCDASSAQSQGGKSIGTKQISGHPCHGYAYSTPSGKTEAWVADDAGVLVQSTTSGPAGKIVMDLKSVSTSAPSGEEFKVPSGYKVTAQ